ncbi:MAG: serine/threonine protein kinase [Coriobacteriales bacterium]|jgi:serine/threonine-protein kinase|nr:serine/threonine protein kinase [Coriobacteriales bacterium]
MLETGQLVAGKYRILRRVGEGGMSVVYDAINERANKHWAVKEIKQESVKESEVTRYNLLAEREILRKLSHPGLPSIVDIVDEDGFFLIVMDYIEGVPLSSVLEEEGPQPQELVVDWAGQLCDVYSYLHSQNPPIIYRDLKPGNVMLRPNGSLCIIDFGTAREYKAGRIDDTIALGTKGYAAPEQHGIHQTDPRTDIYNLGATLYHLLTGHNPSEPPFEIRPIREHDPELSSGLEGIIATCTQQNPEERYQSATELAEDLAHYRDLDIEVRRRRRRLKTQSIVAAAAVVVLLASAGALNLTEGQLVSDSYTSLVSRAQAGYTSATTQAERKTATDDFLQAVEQVPERAEAYTALLRAVYAQDNSISTEEATTLQAILNGSGNKVTTNIDIFAATDPEAASLFLYELGMACFFYLDDGEITTAAKARASQYLEKALGTASLDEDRQAMAESLLLLANSAESAFDTSGRATLAAQIGSTNVTPTEMWDNLRLLTSETRLDQLDNSYIKLAIYRYVLNTIAEHYVAYNQYGIGYTEQLELVDTIGEALRALAVSSEGEDELKESLTDSVASCEKLIAVAQSNGA